ncbi:hypothetical protein N1236_05915 [Acetivibrio thermocellus]|uniref:hypothetical protein n=1 Tax=Acetivibrio thermocellus TaxID=1515 RepID=UPI0021AE1CAF|nr:hypothetical protein [Acetivibrio thermocellus]UWV48043.1 hypothetical protein N1236_05915 [Acetivibrio thermocellus]
MKGVTIFGNFTILETFVFNGVQVDKGFDERLDIFYRADLCAENNDDIDNAYIDCYYRNMDDLKEDLGKLNWDLS